MTIPKLGGRPKIYDEKATISVSCDRDLLERLKEKAAKKGKTLSDYVRPTLARLAK